MIFSNKMYGILKFLAQILLPALAVFYLSVAPLWGFPKQEEVAGTIVALDLLLGALLSLSTSAYNKSEEAYEGYLDSTSVDEDTGIPDMKLVVTKDPSEIIRGNVARFKIGPPPRDYKV